MTQSYFFFRPLLSANHGWGAFDWCPKTPSSVGVEDYIRCYSAANATSLGSMLPLVINIDPSWLDQGTLFKTIGINQAIFILPSFIMGNPEILNRCKNRRSEGYHFGAQIDDLEVIRRIPLAAFDHVSLAATFARSELPATDLSYLGDAGFRKIATRVDSHEMHGWLTGKGFDLCHSAFLSVRNPALARQPDLARLKLLKLLSIVERDGDTREIEAIFREEPKLSYNLLRLVNSVAVGARTRISNFSQAIAILGRRQLQRWLQLLIYANNLTDGNKPNPLMQLAAARGRMIELLCKSVTPQPANTEHGDNAFMTGLFSLLDVLINLPMNEILKELPLQDEVIEALGMNHGGTLGKLLLITAFGESGDFSAAEKLLRQLDISPETHAAAQVSALQWASRINVDNDCD